jgi:hypothetical protein
MTTRLGPGVGVGRAWRFLTAAAAWTPLSLGAALQGWFDAGDASTMWADTGGTVPAGDLVGVARWDDKSGLGRHVTQSGATARPTRDASFTPSVLTTDGGDSLLSSAFTAVSQPYSFVVVSDNLLNSSSFFDNGTGVTRSVAQRGAGGATTITIFANASMTVTGAPDSSTRRAYIFEFNGANSKVWAFDGTAFVQVGATGNAGANTLADFRIFGNSTNRLTSAETCELFAFAGLATAGQRSDIGSYIKNKWGL